MKDLLASRICASPLTTALGRLPTFLGKCFNKIGVGILPSEVLDLLRLGLGGRQSECLSGEGRAAVGCQGAQPCCWPMTRTAEPSSGSRLLFLLSSVLSTSLSSLAVSVPQANAQNCPSDTPQYRLRIEVPVSRSKGRNPCFPYPVLILLEC